MLGVAVDASTVAIFQETVEESEGFLADPQPRRWSGPCSSMRSVTS